MVPVQRTRDPRGEVTLPKIDDVGASSRINVLIHGDIGTGKTTLIGSGGKQYKTLLMRPPTDHSDPIIGSGCKETIVRNWEDIFEVLDYMRMEGHNWDWFWIDSISLLQDIGLDDVYEGVLDQKGPPGSLARKHRAQFGPDRGEYRVNMWRLEQFVRHTVGQGAFNLGITAHSFWYEPEGGDPYLAPWIQGRAMPQKICGMMNVVGYLEVAKRTIRGSERLVRVVNWNKNENYYAKNQFTEAFPSGQSINPTLPQIVEAIENGRKTASNGSAPVQSGRRPVRRNVRR